MSFKSEDAWQLWSESKTADTEARQLQRSYLRQLQGALVHDPELEQAHKELAVLWLKELTEASATGDRRAKDLHSQQYRTHLQFLGASSRSELEEQLAEQLNDVIVQQRFRRGALVGRKAQRESIAEQVGSGDRLITLVGTAGVGKTRLALELAEDLRTESTRSYFCDLTQATDELGVVRLVRIRDAGEDLDEALCLVLDAQRVELLKREVALVRIVVLVARELREREAREQRRLRAWVHWCIGACIGVLAELIVSLLLLQALHCCCCCCCCYDYDFC